MKITSYQVKLMDEKTTVYDIVYKPLKTDLINVAKEKNCKIILVMKCYLDKQFVHLKFG